MDMLWLPIAATCLIGVSCGLPLFLYLTMGPHLWGRSRRGDADHIIARLVTDTSISEPDRELARLHAKHGNATYVYHFSYTPAPQRAAMFGLPHGGEIAYVFNIPRAIPFDEEGKAVASAANKYWAQFAKTGDQAPPAVPCGLSSTRRTRM
ncbi:MAG: carboxylesterase family protein [Pseudomonadota bacterium]|nr:carboxylesterase family protein [Pseudomonadota bacterium]